MFSDTVQFSVLMCDVRWYCAMWSDAVWCVVILCDLQCYCAMCSDTVRCAVILCDVQWYCAMFSDIVWFAVKLRCTVILWVVQFYDVQWYCAMYYYTRQTAVYFFWCLLLGGFFRLLLIFLNFIQVESFLQRAFSSLLTFIQVSLVVTSVITAIKLIHRTNTAHCSN